MAVMTQDQREAADKRVREQLGLPMMGSNPNGSASDDTMQIESEIIGAMTYAFGEIWGRPGLPIRERCFITLGALTAKYQLGPLADYVRASLKVGLTPSEILETFLQVASYSGFTAASEAMNVARRVFEEEGLTKPGADIHPVAPMDHTDRRNAMIRVSMECGMGRHAANDPDAAPLQYLKSGVWTAKAKDLPVENDFNMTGGEFGYGECWGRPTLGFRIRCLITVAGLQALFANDQLCFHINTALNVGITPEELHEVLAHVGIYAGIANWRNAANVAREVFLQRGVVELA
ncbi:MAG: carboxymuconolactone decarboxylase family protein [Novosphingobium sp.]